MIIELLNGTKYNLNEHGLKRLYHYIPSPNIQHDTVNVQGRGDVITNSTLLNRTISVEFLFGVCDIRDFYMLRDELNGIFAREEEFYITFLNEPYKRWRVKFANGFEIEPNRHKGSFVVEFITVNRYAESTGTSLQLTQHDFDAGIWGFGNIINIEERYPYNFTGNEFVVKNIGNVTVDPRYSELEITLRGSVADYFQIKNNTTGDIFRYDGTLFNNQTFLIKNLRVLRNNVSVYRQTNRGIITLAPGDNNFSVEGVEGLAIQFNFKFLYR